MRTVTELEKDIEEIKERNKRVESDKRWEMSLFRKLILMFFTYVSIGLYLSVISISDPWKNAIVPSVGFFLSTLTLPIFRKMWEQYIDKK